MAAVKRESSIAASAQIVHGREKSLLIASLGLALAYVGWPIATAGDICGPRDTLLADGTSLVAFVPLLILLVVLHRIKDTHEETVRRWVVLISVIAQATPLLGMGLLRFAGLCTTTTRFWLCVLLTVATVGAVACWLERARGASTIVAGQFVFTSLLISALLLFILGTLPDGVRALTAGVLALLQLLCFPHAASFVDTNEAEPHDRDDYYAFMMAGAAGTRFLVAWALGLGAIALVAGFLCGFPDDQPKMLSLPARITNCLLTVMLCLGIIYAARHQKNRMLTVGVWVIMELLAGLALLLYNAFANNLEVGAVAAQLLNTLMTGVVWHFIIALMNAGWRNPFYYADVAWLIWLGAHDLGRLLLLVLPIGGSNHFTGAFISLLLLISTQIILVKLIDVGRFNSWSAANVSNALSSQKSVSSFPVIVSPDLDYENAPLSQNLKQVETIPSPTRAEETEVYNRPSALERFLGLDAHSAEYDTHMKAMRVRATRVGELFLLSDREIDVLTLYALGFTQKRVAEELYISPTTAHTHITRIYAKTNLHSRQELLDFMHDHCE